MADFLVLVYGLLSILLGTLPALGIALWRSRFDKKLWMAWVLGGVFWFLAFLLRVIPLNMFTSLIGSNILALFVSALFAGVFETLFRMFLFIYLAKQAASSFEKVLMAGLGWGTVEALLIHIIPLSRLLLVLVDTGSLSQFSENSYLWLLGGYERLIVEFFHVCMFILVFYGLQETLERIPSTKPKKRTFFTKNPTPQWIWLIIVAIVHTGLDFIVTYLLTISSIFIAYTIATVYIVLIGLYIFKRTQNYPLFPTSEGNTQ